MMLQTLTRYPFQDQSLPEDISKPLLQLSDVFTMKVLESFIIHNCSGVIQFYSRITREKAFICAYAQWTGHA